MEGGETEGKDDDGSEGEGAHIALDDEVGVEFREKNAGWREEAGHNFGERGSVQLVWAASYVAEWGWRWRWRAGSLIAA
jgi:hypothetical protein